MLSTMKTYRILWFVCAMFLSGSLAGSEASAPFVWSEPTPLTLVSENGPMQATKQSCRATNGFFAPLIDIIYGSDNKSVWIGYSRPMTTYFSLNGAIWSAKGNGAQSLELIRPRTMPTGQLMREFGNQWIAELLQGKKHWPSYEQGVVLFNLARIFGINALCDLTSSMQGNTLAITSIQFTNHNVAFNLQTRNGNQFQLVLSSDIELVSAAQNGHPVSVLVDARMPGSQNPWTQRKIMVQSANVPVPADSCERLFVLPEAVDVPGLGKGSMPVISYSPSFCVAVLPTGQVWSGPAKCLLAQVDEKIMGFTINPQTRELLVFGGPRAQISMEPGQTMPALRKVLAEVEAEVATGTIVPMRTIKIASLFDGDQTLTNGADLSLRRLSIEGKNLVLVVRNLQGHENLTVTLAPSLEVVSASRAVGPN